MIWYIILHISIFFMESRIFMSHNSEKCEVTLWNNSPHFKKKPLADSVCSCLVEYLVLDAKHFAHCSLVSAQILKSNLAAMEQNILHLERDIKNFPKAESHHDKFVEKMRISFI